MWLIEAKVSTIAASFIPLRTDPYRPGCSTVAVNPFEQTPLADIITDDNKVLQSLHELHIPYLCDLVFSGLHRIAFLVVLEWYQVKSGAGGLRVATSTKLVVIAVVVLVSTDA